MSHAVDPRTHLMHSGGTTARADGSRRPIQVGRISSTMNSASSQTDSTTTHIITESKQSLYATPLIDLSESDLKKVKQQFPHVYTALLQFEKLLRQATASLEAKEQELRRCIDVGQEVLGQLELVRGRCAELAAEKEDLQVDLHEATTLLHVLQSERALGPDGAAHAVEEQSHRSDVSPSSPPPALPLPPSQRELQDLRMAAEHSREACRVAVAQRDAAEEQRKRAEQVSADLDRRLFDAQRESALLAGELTVKNSRIEELLQLLSNRSGSVSFRELAERGTLCCNASEAATKKDEPESKKYQQAVSRASRQSESARRTTATSWESAEPPARELLMEENVHLRHELGVLLAEVAMLRTELRSASSLPSCNRSASAGAMSHILAPSVRAHSEEGSLASARENPAEKRCKGGEYAVQATFGVHGEGTEERRRLRECEEEIRVLWQKLTAAVGVTAVTATRNRESSPERDALRMEWEREKAELVAHYESIITGIRCTPRREVSVASTALDDLQHERKRQNQHNAALKGRVDELEDVVIPRLEQQLRATKQSLEQVTGENRNLDLKLVQCKAKEDASKEQLIQQTRANETLQDALEALGVEHKCVKRAHDEVKDELARVTEGATIHQLRRQEVERERDCLEGALKSLRFETLQIQRELANVSADDESATNKMRERIEKLTTERTDLKAQLQAQERDVESYVERVYECEATIRKLELELESASERRLDQESRTVPIAMFTELEKDYQQLEAKLRSMSVRGEAESKRVMEVESQSHELQQRLFLLQRALMGSPPPQLNALESMTRELRAASRAVPRWFPGVNIAPHNRAVAASVAAVSRRRLSSPAIAKIPSASVPGGREVSRGLLDALYVKRFGDDSSEDNSEGYEKGCSPKPKIAKRESVALSSESDDDNEVGEGLRSVAAQKVREQRARRRQEGNGRSGDEPSAAGPRSLESTLSPPRGATNCSTPSRERQSGGKDTLAPAHNWDNTHEFGKNLLLFLSALYSEMDALTQLSRAHWEYITASTSAAATAPKAAVLFASCSPSTGVTTPRQPISTQASPATSPPPFLFQNSESGVGSSGSVSCPPSQEAPAMGVIPFQVSPTDPSVSAAAAAYKRLRQCYKHYQSLHERYTTYSLSEVDGGPRSCSQLDRATITFLSSPSPTRGRPVVLHPASNVFSDFLKQSHSMWVAVTGNGNNDNADTTRPKRKDAQLCAKLADDLRSQKAQLEMEVEKLHQREAACRQQLMAAQEDVLHSKREIHRLLTQIEGKQERMQNETSERRAMQESMQRVQTEWEAERKRWKEEVSTLSRDLLAEREKLKELKLDQQRGERQRRTEVDTALLAVKEQMNEERRVSLQRLQDENTALQAEVLQLQRALGEGHCAMQRQAQTLQDVKREFDLSNRNFIALHNEHEEQERQSKETIRELQQDLLHARSAVEELRKEFVANEGKRARELEELRSLWRTGATREDGGGDGGLSLSSRGEGELRCRLQLEVDMLQKTLDAERQTLTAIRAANRVLEKRITELEGDREPLRQQLRSLLSYT